MYSPTTANRNQRGLLERVVANQVLMVLVVTSLVTAIVLPFAAMSPNRLASGEPVSLIEALLPWQSLALTSLGLILLVTALRVPLTASVANRVTLIVAPLALLLTLYGLGDYAARIQAQASPAARVSQGAAFWTLLFCFSLMIVDAFQRLRTGLILRSLYLAAALLALAALFAWGTFDALSIMREYANHRASFAGQFATHLKLVTMTLVPALTLGLPLGLLAHRRAAVRGPLFGLLNFFQTIPSIALFALLVAPLSALGDAFPLLKRMGISGIGTTPAVIALIMYALLPVVRNTYAGFAGISAEITESARGMGMTPHQILWQVEVPLALPVILSGLRIVTVQAIGLTVVAALIGAGGFGAFIFQGLGQYAIDLVLLGAIPTIALALVADFLLQILITLSKPPGAR